MISLAIMFWRWLFPPRRRPALARRRLWAEPLEDRLAPALPDLAGYDFRPNGFPTAYMHVEESAPSWGDQIHLDFAYANLGASPASSQTFNISLYLSNNATINPATDYLFAHLTSGLFTVPNAGSGQSITSTLTLPASNPLATLSAGPITIGMFVDADNTVAEANEGNNTNQGGGKDLTTVSILPAAAVVTDSVGSSTDHAVNFGSIVVDGAGNAQTIQTITLSDAAARSLLKVPQNGISLATGTNFRIVSIISNKLSQAVNTAGGSSLIAANSSETWTIQVAFDPVAVGALTDTLVIRTDDPSNQTINVALSGSGTPAANLVVSNPVNQSVNFGNIAVDGAGGAFGSTNVTLTNNGSGPVTVSQNGITVPGGGPFTITSITSSTQGAINLASGSRTIAAGNAETWTVAVKFDPTATGLYQTPITITSNSPQNPTTTVSLLGTGQTPMHLVAPAGPVAFGSVAADGAGRQLVTQTIALTNTGQLPLQVNQNGITLQTGTHFKVAGVASSTQGAIDLAVGPATIAGSSAETWTVTVQFDPASAGALSDNLRIASNDPGSPTTSIGVNGAGLNQPILVYSDNDSIPADLTTAFVPTLNDGAGGRSSTQTVTLTNIGTQPLVVSQNGVRALTGTNFQVVSIISSVNGSINLAAASASIAPLSAETWTVSVSFDPQSSAPLSDTLRVTSNDPVNATLNAALTGQGVVPTVSAIYPTQAIHVSASRAYRITWTGAYSPGTGAYSLYYDTDRNPASGLVAIVSGLPQSRSYYDWQVPTNLVGSSVTIYATLQDGAVTAGSYAAGSLTVDAAGSDRMISAPVTDTAAYILSYVYNGTAYAAGMALAPGDNLLFVNGGGVTHEYHVTRAASLVDSANSAYDELGNVTATTDSNGQATTFQYDQLARVSHVGLFDGSGVDYAYDAASNLVTMHDGTGWQIYAYDARDRLVSVTYSPTNNVSDPAALIIGYEFDLDSHLTALVYPSGKRVEYAYTNGGKLTTVTEKNSGQPNLVTTYAYSSTTGLLTTTTRPNDTQTINSYDANGKLVDILHQRTSTSALILRYRYTLDAAARRTMVVITSPTGVRAEAYVYNDFGWLTQVTYSDDNGTIDATDRVVKYTYDLNGNRLTQTTYANGIAAGATQTLTYAYGFENRLLTVTDQNNVVQAQYFYDWRGNQVEKVTPTGTTQYGYDGRNLLVSVDDGTNHIEYQYDGAGRRVGQTVNGVATRFVVDPSDAVFQTIEERDAAGVVISSYAYGAGRISGVFPGQSGPTYYLHDALGSVAGLTNNSGADLGQYKYDAFGSVLAAPAGSGNQFNFVGEREDTLTHSVFLRARDYDPATGRFMSKDPLHPDTGLNAFTYAASNPVEYTDPTGKIIPVVAIADLIILGGGIIDAGVSAAKAYAAGQPLSEVGYQAERGFIRGTASTTAGLVGGLLGPEAGAIASAATSQVVGELVDVLHGGRFEPSLSEFGTSALLGYAGGQVAKDLIPNGVGAPADLFLGRSASYELGVNATTQVTQKFVGKAFSTLGGLAIPGPGGVLIDQAATLIGANIKDITGATFDPVSHQLIFLGNNSPAALHNVNLDLFTTAIQSVYGSAVPPYVTLDPPAKLVQQSFNVGDGDGVILNNKTATVVIHYTPYSPTEADDMTLTFNVNGTPVTARLDGYLMNIFAGGRQAMGITTLSLSGAPSGLAVTMLPKGTIGGGEVLTVNAQGQDSYWIVSIANTTGSAQTVTNLKLITDLQHRKFGGRVDNTKLGWIMEEADRVMKELGGGKDQLTGAIYDSHNSALPAGFQNTLERYVAANQSGSFSNRFWFTPNYEQLERYIDPVTGEATVVFSQSAVKLNTEALILGQPEDVTAKAFADYFNANYDALASVSFPVHDPNDPTGNAIIQDKIFQDLRDAMKAVALARFFHDNNIPLDTWWINSWKAPTASVPATIPTLTNSLTNGAITVNFYGGVSIKTPNTYLPDVVAQAISAAVKAQRPVGAGDLGAQAFNVTGTSVGTLNAVAASLDAQKQDGSVTLGSTDLSFASSGGAQLRFERYYDSAFLGDKSLGLGWQPTRFDLQFQLPSFVDDYRMIRDGSGNQVPVTGAVSDTLLHSGELRIVDHASGQLLNFFSSLTISYALDNQGNPILATAGLTANDVPTFAAGQYQDGSTLAQDKTTHNYTLTHLDGATLVFDPQGSLLTTTDKIGNTITFGYANGKLSQITDSAGQKLAVTYGSDGRIQYVAGPDNTANPLRRSAFTYDAGGRLVKVETQVLQSGSTYATARSTQYQYNASNQLSGVIGPDGLTTLTNTPDLRGRSSQQQDVLGNMLGNSFTQDAAGNHTTQATDLGTTAANNPTAQGVDALKYFATGASSSTQFDGTARTTQTVDALGHAMQYGYTGAALLPTSVTLPTPGRPAISIQRNAANLPTVITDPANTGGAPVQIAYNAANLPTQVTDAKGRITKYTYTAWNDIATVTVAFGTALEATTTYNYNAQKLLQTIVDPRGHTIATYTYDSLGRVLSVKDGDNVTTTITYDSIGRLKRVYDPRLTGSTNYLEYTWNDNDQVSQIATPTGTITYQYDATTHRLTSVTDLTGATTQYGYEPASGLLTSVTQVSAAGNAVTQEVYDRRGQLVLLIAPQGNHTAFRSDALGRPSAVFEDNGANPAASINVATPTGSTMTVNVTATEPILVGAIKYWINGQPQSTGVTQAQRLSDQGTFAFNLSGLDNTKAYQYQMTLTDRAGTSATLPIGILDTTAPSAALTQQPAAFTASTSATLAFTGSDNLTVAANLSFLASLDNAAFAAATSPVNYSNLATGSHTFRVEAIDEAGNVGAPTSYTWTIDTTPPSASITQQPAAITNSTSATFAFTGSDNVSSTANLSFLVSLDNAGFAAATSPKNYTSLAAGSHNFRVESVDQAGNVSSPVSYTWTIDTTAPSASITQQPASVTASTSAAFSFTGSDNLTPTANLSFLVSLDNAAFAAATSPKNYTSLADGSHNFRVESVDQAGNVSTPASYTWTVDLTPPSASITQQPAAFTASTSATFAFTGSDNVTPAANLSFLVSLDNAAFAAATSPVSYNSLATGSHSFRVESVDQVGNVSSPAAYAWTIDTTAPSASITQQPAAITNSTSATFAFTGSDNVTAAANLSFLVSLDNAAFAAATSPKNYSSLATGAHNFRVESVDQAGNVSGPASYSWTIDTAAPSASITQQPAALTNSTSATFAFTGSDNVTSAANLAFLVSLDNVAFVAATSPKSYSNLAAGGHNFRVESVDEAGNVSSPASFSWTIDTTSPSASITQQPAALSNNTSASFAFTGSDNVTATANLSYLVSLDNAAFVAAATPKNYTGLSSASHNFRVESVDEAGNISTPASYAWTVDTTPPAAGVVNDGTGADVDFQASANTIAANWIGFSDPGSGVASYTWAIGTTPGGIDLQGFTSVGAATSASVSGLSLAVGTSYFVSVRATDSVGNVGAAVSSNGVTVVTFFDDFNRASLGAAWTNQDGTASIVSGQASVGASQLTLATPNGVALTDVILQADIALGATSGAHAGLVARYAGPAERNFYVGMVYNNGGAYQAYIFLNQAGAYALLAVRDLTGFTGAGKLRFEVIGQELKLFVNGALRAVAYDATIAGAGLVGLRGIGSTFDNFSVAPTAAKSAALPFADSFTQANNAELDRAWTERVDAFSIQNQSAVPANLTATSLATLNAPAAGDVSAQADVSLPGVAIAGAGLVARCTDTKNFYLGLLFNNSGAYEAYLFVNQAGAFAQLGYAKLSGFTGAGLLRFEVAGNQLKLFVNNVLQVIAYDSTLTGPGRVGMRSFAAAIDNFQAAAIQTQTTTLPFQDTFTNSNNAALDRVWTERADAFSIQNGKATPVGFSGASMATVNAPTASDVSVRADVTLAGASSGAGLMARYGGPGSSYYLGMIYNNGGVFQAYLFLNQQGAFAQLGVVNLTGFTGSGNLRFEVVGKQLKLFVNNSLQLVAYDAVLTAAGLVGMRGYAATIDNFNASAMPAQTANRPFADAFTRPDNADLDRVWTEQAGAFTTQNSRAADAAGIAGVSLATLNTAALTDTSTQTRVTLLGSGSGAGLVARYSGAGQGSYYLAMLYNNGGVYQAYIFLNQGGSFTQLAEQDLVGFTGSGTLRFDVAGTSLKLSVDGVQQASATNSALTTGLVGIRSAFATLDDFTLS